MTELIREVNRVMIRKVNNKKIGFTGRERRCQRVTAAGYRVSVAKHFRNRVNDGPAAVNLSFSFRTPSISSSGYERTIG